MTQQPPLTRLDFVPFLRQDGRLLKLTCALPSPALVPERMVMREAVNQPFELVVDCLASSMHFELKALIGEQLSLQLLQPDASYAPWHGYVFEARQLGTDGGVARFRLVMRPWLAFLELQRDSRVWQDCTALEIVEAVFGSLPQAHWRCEVGEALRRRSLCVQYRESSLAFVSRLLAEEGLAYHFEHLAGDAAADADAAGHARHVMVIADRSAGRRDLGDVRFTVQHPSARVFGQRDSITAFMARRRVQATAVTLGSWDYKRAAGVSAQTYSALELGELPRLEVYDGAGAYRYEDAAHAERAAGLALQALELDVQRFEGQGSARHLAAGARFSLVDHPLYGANTTAFTYPGALTAGTGPAANAFTVLAVEHHATNNLGVDIARLADADAHAADALEHGTYKNHFHCAPAAAPVVPRFVRKPTAPGAQTALVVGVPGEALSTERDGRVKIQFACQRGERPNPGGLHAEAGHAPGDASSGTWVRVAVPTAGADWGSVYTPRIGSEVLVEFVEGDIDRPVITACLYNGAHPPPFAAGEDSGVNHAGVIDGVHSQALDGAGFNQWLLDNTSGQLRMRLLCGYTTAELGLGHLIQHAATGAQRGAWRGSGFEAGTHGWATLRAARGMLVSTSLRAGTYGSAQSTQMDAAEAVGQLKAARELGTRLDGAATQAGALGLKSHAADEALDKLTRAIDPAQQGKHPGPVNGQPAVKARPGSRDAGDPVEAFAQPLLVQDTPSTAIFASEAQIAAYAGQDASFTAQGDVQHAAAHTIAQVSGGTTSWHAQANGAKLIAAHGAVSLRAHTDALSILADKEVTVTSVNDEITIAAQQRIELVGGESSIVLDGANIDFACTGTWAAKLSAHAFLDGGSDAAVVPALPVGTLAEVPNWIELRHTYEDLEPVTGATYKVIFDDGSVRQGALDAQGFVRLDGVKAGVASVEYGEDARAWQLPAERRNADYGAGTDEASAASLYARYFGAGT